MKERGLPVESASEGFASCSLGETYSIQPAHPYLLTVNQISFGLGSRWGQSASNFSFKVFRSRSAPGMNAWGKEGGWRGAEGAPNSSGADFVTCQDSETTANHLRPPANCDQQPKSDVTANRTRPTVFAFLARHHYCNAASIALTRSPLINQLVSGRQGEL
jgi:hypothetical protein